MQDYRNALVNAQNYPEFDHAEGENYVRKSGARVIERKGATYYAVSMSVCHICKCVLSGIDTTLTVSTMLHGEYGIDDVCLSLLNVVGDKGAHAKIMLPLTEEEQAEQKRLREEYVASFRESLRAQLESTTVVNPDGTSYRLREKKK